MFKSILYEYFNNNCQTKFYKRSQNNFNMFVYQYSVFEDLGTKKYFDF